jgi:cell division protein FtsW
VTTFARTDTSILGRWWWTVDRWTLAAISLLIAFGVLLIMAASPSVAERIGLDPFHFVRRQFVFLPLVLALLFCVSMLSHRAVRRVAIIVFLATLALLAATLGLGEEIKGARRWIGLFGYSIQPSEFVKPAFTVVTAWLLSLQRSDESFPGKYIAAGLLAIILVLLLQQPDIGMAVMVSGVWFLQFVLAGISLWWLAPLAGLMLAGLTLAYFTFPHVTSRIDRFIDPASSDNYQVMKAQEAFMNGGLWGRGPGEGTVKEALPDAHADFILAVAGEEFGLLVCLVVVALYAFVVLRGLARLLNEDNPFTLLAVAGLLAQFGGQALINMASTLHLMPTKGTTLPFLSYGGSSMVAIAFTLGMVLALTRRRVSPGDLP